MTTAARLMAISTALVAACATRAGIDTVVRASTLDPAAACAASGDGTERELHFAAGQPAARVTCRDGVLEGTFVAFHPNGTRRALGQYRGGERTGAWREWHANGQLWMEGSYRDGKRDGRWVEYQATGDVKFEGTYVNGLLDGAWTSYCETGGVHAKGRSIAGKLEGTVTVRSCRSEERTEQVFVHNRPHGIWRSFIGEKPTIAISYRDGVYDGPMQGYDAEGGVEWTFPFANGLPVEGGDDAE